MTEKLGKPGLSQFDFQIIQVRIKYQKQNIIYLDIYSNQIQLLNLAIP